HSDGSRLYLPTRRSSDLEDYFGRTAMVGRNGEGHLEIGCIAPDEGIARVLRPRPAFLARGRHGEREILRSVPDRDEAGEGMPPRSEEHTSELQSLAYLVC